jgi:hypothetical protein
MRQRSRLALGGLFASLAMAATATAVAPGVAYAAPAEGSTATSATSATAAAESSEALASCVKVSSRRNGVYVLFDVKNTCNYDVDLRLILHQAPDSACFWVKSHTTRTHSSVTTAIFDHWEDCGGSVRA